MLSPKKSSSTTAEEERYLEDLLIIKNLNKETLNRLNELQSSYDGCLPKYIEDEIYSCMKKTAIFQNLFSSVNKSWKKRNLSGVDLGDYIEESQELIGYKDYLLRLMDDSSSDDSLYEANSGSLNNRKKFDSNNYMKNFIKTFFNASKPYLPHYGVLDRNTNSTSTLLLLSAESFFNVTLPGESKVRLEAIPEVTLKEIVLNAIKNNEEDADNILLLDTKENRIIKSDLPSTVFVGMNLKVYYRIGNETLVENFHEIESKTMLIPASCFICKESFHIGVRCKQCTKSYHKKCYVRFPTLCDRTMSDKTKPSMNNLNNNNLDATRQRSKTASKLLDNISQNMIIDQKKKTKKNSAYNLQEVCEQDFVRESKVFTENVKQKTEDPKVFTKKLTLDHFGGIHANEKKKRHICKETWEIDVGEVKLVSKIGSGTFGTVYKAEWHGCVAVKVLNLKDPSNDQIEAFKNETLIFRKTRHNNILLYMGCFYTPHLAIVTEWCDGALYSFLHVKEAKYTQKRLVEIAIESANGMSYLHDRNIIHRDLKSNNILLRNNVVKIGDFGLSVVKSKKPGLGTIQQPTGSILWMAPEVIRMSEKSPYTFNSDVYSFGIVLYELLSLKLPYQNIGSRDQILYMVGRGYLKPDEADIKSYIGSKLVSIYKKCINFDRYARPSFADIGIRLKAYLAEIPSISRSTSTKIKKENVRSFNIM